MISELGENQICPRCQLQVSVESMMNGFVACNHCGWSPVESRNSRSAFSKNNKKVVYSLSIFSALFALSFIHIMNWDRHSLSIIPLKIEQLVGLASAKDLREISDICAERMKYDCVDSALTELGAINSTPEDYLRLGDLRRKLGDHKNAIAAYNKVLGLEDTTSLSTTLLADANYGAAKSHEVLGQIDAAARFYQNAIEAKPEVIQITVTESYLNMLKQAGRTESAEKVIVEARRRGGSDRLFSKNL